MSQNWADDCYNYSGHQVVVDMQQIENNLAALKSMFSGTSAPADPIAGMCWFDENTGKSPKIRNKANAAWLGLMQADASHKLWVYRNTAPDGWAIDAAVVDVVLALKGGTAAYNANGGTQAGTWTQPDCTLSVAQIPAHDHGAQTPAITVTTRTSTTGSGATNFIGVGDDVSQGNNTNTTVVTAAQPAHTHTSVGSGAAHNHGTVHRPAAAVGTMQYMNI
jgi:hypothetical protein